MRNDVDIIQHYSNENDWKLPVKFQEAVSLRRRVGDPDDYIVNDLPELRRSKLLLFGYLANINTGAQASLIYIRESKST